MRAWISFIRDTRRLASLGTSPLHLTLLSCSITSETRLTTAVTKRLRNTVIRRSTGSEFAL